ncbi:MAG: putative nucleic acid-binding protein [Limisphaerales bacterium]|jgi:predicted nucleic acid-binding protein
MAGLVLDSYALIAYFRDEDGADTVETLLVKATQSGKPLLMSEVNYSEAKYMVVRKDGNAAWEKAADMLRSLPIEFFPADRQMSELAADFKAKHRISLADAFAAALTKEKRATLVTGDAEFQSLEGEIKIKWLE